MVSISTRMFFVFCTTMQKMLNIPAHKNVQYSALGKQRASWNTHHHLQYNLPYHLIHRGNVYTWSSFYIWINLCNSRVEQLCSSSPNGQSCLPSHVYLNGTQYDLWHLGVATHRHSWRSLVPFHWHLFFLQFFLVFHFRAISEV